MDTYQVSLGGALLVIAFSLVYVVLFFMVLCKIFGQQGKKAEQFCARAERDGRMVTAHREDYRLIPFNEDGRQEYVGRYSYTAPNGKRYNMRAQDCQRFINIPPETITLYLERGNYRKYYIKGSLNMGKHGGAAYLLSLLIGLFVYFSLISHILMPLVLH